MTFFLVASAVKVFVVFNLIMVAVALLTLAERRICAWMQDRLGPNRVGPQGLLQPAADGLKNFLKEETYPALADKTLFILAPLISFVPALLTFAVIPFAAPLPTPWGVVPMVVADLPVGFLYILAISSLGVYGIVLAGWSSNNKYALLGGLRASAQMISYEIALGMSTVAVLLLAGNVTLSQVIAQQQIFTEGSTNAFLVGSILMLAASAVIWIFLDVKHEELATDGPEGVVAHAGRDPSPADDGLQPRLDACQEHRVVVPGALDGPELLERRQQVAQAADVDPLENVQELAEVRSQQPHQVQQAAQPQFSPRRGCPKSSAHASPPVRFKG